MRNRILLILIFVLNNFLIHAQTQDKWVKGEVYIKIKEGSFKQARVNSSKEREVTASDLAVELPFLEKNKAKFKLKEVQRSFHFSKSESLRRIYRVQFEDDTKIDSLITVISKNPMVEYIERIPLSKIDNIFPISKITNPFLLDDDWHLKKIKAYEAWDIAPKQVKKDIIIAVVDNAIQTDHPSLVGHFVEPIFWQDVSDNDFDPKDYTKSHGSHVAGIISSTPSILEGTNSISNNRLKILPIKATKTSNSDVKIDNPVEGIEWATNMNADIINCSFKTEPTQTLKDVIDNAISQNCIIVAAAGNSDSEVFYYPSSYDGVISVSNTDENDIRYSEGVWCLISCGSTYNIKVDISAPGKEIKSTIPINQFDKLTGTSMSAPLIAGAIGFLKSYLPYASMQELETLIKNSADNIDAANNPT